jgi:chromosome segregation ATPase
MTPQQNLLKKPAAKPAINTLSELSKNLTMLQQSVIELVQKQSTLMEKLDQFVNKVVAHEERLKRLEDNSLNHLESATWIKAGIKFWPLIIACLLLGHQIHALLLNYQLH